MSWTLNLVRCPLREYWVRCFGMIRISDPRSLRSLKIKWTDESLFRVDSSVHLIYYDPSDLRSLILIRIIAKECTHWLYHEWSCSFVKILLLVHLHALECALDGFHKLSHMAEEFFGEDVFSSGRKKGKQNINVSGKRRPFSIIMLACNYPMSPLRTCHWIVCLACYFFVPAVPLSSFNNSYFPFPKHCIIVLIVSITKCFNLIGT